MRRIEDYREETYILKERQGLMLNTIKRLREENARYKEKNKELNNKIEAIKNSIFEEFIQYSIKKSIKEAYNKTRNYITVWGDKLYEGTPEYDLYMSGQY